MAEEKSENEPTPRGLSVDEQSDMTRQRIYAHCKAAGNMAAYYASYPSEAPPGFFDDKPRGRGRGGR